MGKKLVVIGGGAAGFFCAVNAAKLNPDLDIVLIEKTGRMLSKVRVSGGGRCNVTHACFSVDEMIKKYPRGSHFLRKAFSHFFTHDCIQWFQERGVLLKEEPDGRMFPVTDNSQTIIDCLVKEANRYGIHFLMNQEIKSIRTDSENGRFLLQGTNGYSGESDFLCIACGGYPKHFLFDWILATGHTIEQPLPSLFTFNVPGNSITSLMGISVPDVQVKITGSKLQERAALLITHWGFSGPVILRLSAWGARELAQPGSVGTEPYHFSIKINWLPDYKEAELRKQFQQMRLERGAQLLGNKNPFNLPQRLWQYLLQDSGIAEKTRWAELPAALQQSMTLHLTGQLFAVKGKTTFKEEFVTAGGIKLSEINPHTMESRIVPNLFFAGEIMDVDGITGGFNFQNAWTSGYIAAKSVAEKASARGEGMIL